MPTTIQVNENTLKVLRKIKDETNSSSYDEAINKLVMSRDKESLSGFLGKRPMKTLMSNIREKDERA